MSNIYQPYTYQITWTEHNKNYYGVRWANKCVPKDDLWTHYFTSSQKVKQYRKEFGEPDIIKIDKIFDSVEDARNYEIQFLTENNCVKSTLWLNASAFPVCDNTGQKRAKQSKFMIENNPMKKKEVRKKMSILMKGRVFSDEHRANMSTCHKGKKISKPRSKEYLLKQSLAQKGQVRKKIQCPHCNKIGGASGGMFRFHFDNCSQRPS